MHTSSSPSIGLMRPEVRVMWADALSSKKFTRGRGFLKVTTQNATLHCPYGVLTELARSNDVVISARPVSWFPPIERWYFDNDASLPCEAVRLWASLTREPLPIGLTVRVPIEIITDYNLDPVRRKRSILQLNDKTNVPWKVLADLIRP